MTNWFQFPLISHLRLPRRNVLERPIASPAEAQCERVTDAREAQQPEERARSAAVDVFRENFDAVAS